MFTKILIANRGEIAIRIMRACRELGISTVAVYSEADRNALFAKYADEAVYVGPSPASQSYLRIDRILEAAEETGSEGIHPGYGFLSENPAFARACEEKGVVFIGPTSRSIDKMGSKIAARDIMKSAGVPIVPGSEGGITDPQEAVDLVESIGYPILLKPAAGGGGIGMKIVWEDKGLGPALDSARSIARSAFGDETVYIEKYLAEPRHIEFQILADSRGKTIHVSDRECSIQRRHQKLLEESPSPAVTPSLRKKMGECAVKLMKMAHYEGAATVEFLLDEDGLFYFMEVNTRIQVEHPVTEEVTGVDLIQAQVAVAAGERIAPLRKRLQPLGHAIEFRINAEDPKTFVPSPGKVTGLVWPGGPGVRVDSHLYAGYTVPPHYDSLLAKIIVRGADRAEAIRRARRALSCTVVEGVKTSIPLFLRILDNAAFAQGDLSTRFLERQAIV